MLFELSLSQIVIPQSLVNAGGTMLKTAMAAILVAVPSIVSTQAKSEKPPLNARVDWTVEASPILAIDRADFEELERADIMDQSEFSLAAEFVQEWPNDWDIRVGPKVALNPNWLNEADETSAVSMEASVDRQIRSHWFGVKYALGANYDGILDNWKKSDQTISPIYRGEAKFEPGLTLRWGAEWQFVNSSDDAGSFDGPSLSFKFIKDKFGSAPFGLSLSASSQWRRYDSRIADDGIAHADADRIRLQADLLLTEGMHQMLPEMKGIGFKLGLRWTQTNSNVAALEGDEWAVVPTFSRKW